MRALMLVSLALLLSGCARYRAAPDLDWLYAAAREVDNRPPLILMHGQLGSRLVDQSTGKERWPGSLYRMLFSRYPDLAMTIDPETLTPEADGLVPSALFDASLLGDYYGRIRAILEGPGGYLPGQPGKAPGKGEAQYYVLVYDWRQDAVKTAQQLSHLVEQIKRDYHDPTLKVDIIAHSMGGLVARYYARYGTVDLLDDNDFPVSMSGADNIRRMILLGTPNLGSVGGIMAMVEGNNPAIRRVHPEMLMTMPSVYQLFPHALNDWLITADGRPLVRDQFDALIWRRFEIGPWDPALKQRLLKKYDSIDEAQAYHALLQRYFTHQLERGRRFTWALTVPTPEHDMAIILLGGDCEPTPARMLVEEIEGQSHLRLWPKEIQQPLKQINYRRIMLEPGDGTVTKASLLGRTTMNPAAPRHRYINFPEHTAFFLCERHDLLSSNITFQNNLLNALLQVD